MWEKIFKIKHLFETFDDKNANKFNQFVVELNYLIMHTHNINAICHDGLRCHIRRYWTFFNMASVAKCLFDSVSNCSSVCYTVIFIYRY